METTTDLRLVLSRELDTEDLSLEHDTVVVSPEFSRRVMDVLRSGAEKTNVSEPAAPVT
jgi:hypothetical protein